MTILSLESVALSYGLPPLLEDISCAIDRGERVCLIGRNGTGKSTLLKIITGEVHPDGGEVRFGQGMTVARLAQEVPLHGDASVFDVVAEGLGDLGTLVRDYFHLSHHMTVTTTADELTQLAHIQQQLDDRGGWEIEQRTERVISRLGLDAETPFNALSGGLKRRVLLAQALVRGPDLLLLDEPTNHLDIDSIDWLEGFLKDFQGGLLFVTHDRRFLQRVATRILELDRGASPTGRETMPTICAARRSGAMPSPRPMPSSTVGWRTRRSGSGRASRRGVPATRVGCAPWRPCAASAWSGVSNRAPHACA